jgi:hypothetical protein
MALPGGLIVGRAQCLDRISRMYVTLDCFVSLPDSALKPPQRSAFNWPAVAAFHVDRSVVGLKRGAEVFALMQIAEEHPVYAETPASDRALYVAFLETWHRGRETVPRQQLSGLGITMVRFAVVRSMQLGLQGRLGLHTVPKARTFYEKLGFVEKPAMLSNEYGEPYLELAVSTAQRLLDDSKAVAGPSPKGDVE